MRNLYIEQLYIICTSAGQLHFMPGSDIQDAPELAPFILDLPPLLHSLHALLQVLLSARAAARIASPDGKASRSAFVQWNNRLAFRWD